MKEIELSVSWSWFSISNSFTEHVTGGNECNGCELDIDIYLVNYVADAYCGNETLGRIKLLNSYKILQLRLPVFCSSNIKVDSNSVNQCANDEY